MTAIAAPILASCGCMISRAPRSAGGSWIILPTRPPGLVTFSAVLIYEMGFDCLNFAQSHFDVRLENRKVIDFHLRSGAEPTESNDLDQFFVFPRRILAGISHRQRRTDRPAPPSHRLRAGKKNGPAAPARGWGMGLVRTDLKLAQIDGNPFQPRQNGFSISALAWAASRPMSRNRWSGKPVNCRRVR